MTATVSRFTIEMSVLHPPPSTMSPRRSALLNVDPVEPMVKLKFAVVFKAVASVAVMLKVSVPFVVGVPEINPALESESPGGSAPEASVKV